MSKSSLIALALIAAGLAAYIAVYERDSLSSKELSQRSGRVLAHFVRSRVERVEIERGGEWTRLARSRDDEGIFGDWRLTAPVEDAADESAVDGLLGELEWLDDRRTLRGIAHEEANKFGLDAPRLRLRFSAGGQTQTLEVGSEDVHGEGVYARLAGSSDVLVVSKTLPEALDVAYHTFRTKQFLGEMTIAWARSVQLATQGQQVSLSRKQKRWWVDADAPGYADDGAVEKFLRSLDDLRATRYLPRSSVPRAQAALARSTRWVRIKIVPDEGREDVGPRIIELRVGPPCEGHEGELVAALGAEGAPVCVAESELEWLATADAWRQHSPLGLAPNEVESFTLGRGDDALALKRDGEKWVANNERTEPLAIDRTAVELWLAELSEARAERFESASGQAADRPTVLSVTSAEGEARGLRLAGSTPSDGIRLIRADEPLVVGYPPQVAALLEPQPLRFAPLERWRVKPSQVVAFEARSGGARRSLVLADATWRQTAGGPEVADAFRVRELVRELSVLSALRFVSLKPSPEHGLSAPTTQLTLRLAQPDAAASRSPLVVMFGNAIGDRVYARLPDGPVYEVPRKIEAFVHELADPGSREPVPSPAEPPRREPDPHAGHHHD